MTVEDVELYAYVGEDEFGSGTIGLKQGRVPAGIIPLVAIASDRHKLETPGLLDQLKRQAAIYGKTIRLVRFKMVEVVREIEPTDLGREKPR